MRRVDVPAEAQDDAALGSVDPIQAGERPDGRERQQDRADAEAAARRTGAGAASARAAAAEQRAQPPLQVADHLVEVRRTLLRLVTAPGVALAGITAGFVPRHVDRLLLGK